MRAPTLRAQIVQVLPGLRNVLYLAVAGWFLVGF
jgi:hypothetical protein